MTGAANSISNRGLLFLGASLAALTVASPAWAQDAEVVQPAEQTEAEVEQAAAPSTTQAEPEGSDIVVLGSRIRTSPYNSPDPVTIIDPALAAKEGKFDLANTLQSSPIAAGSTQITSAISSNFVTAGGPGAQTIDLRGLGPNRTLVLLNGRRAGPAGTRGAVSSFDLNVLPQSIAQNIQILKTGASSVYGSDAVAGVVNIETKRDFDGLQLDANVSVPFDSGGENYRISAIWGKKFSRGNILLAVDYSHQNELARGDRGYLACPQAYTFREDGSRADLIDPRTGKPKCQDLPWGHIWTYNLIDNLYLDGPGGPNSGVNTSILGGSVLMQYQYPGETLGLPAFGTPAFGSADFGAPAGWFATGYDTPSIAVQNSYHPFVEEQTIIPKTDLFTIYSQGAFELTDSIEGFGEFLFNRRKTYQNGWRQFWNFGFTGDLYSTGAGNAYNYWGDGFQGYNYISPTGITNHSDNSQKVDYYRGVGGFRGSLGSNWKWETYVQYSKSIGRYRSEQILQDVYDTGYFQFSSCVGTVTPISGKQCIDLPWADPYFLRGEMTQEQVDFLFDWEEGKTVYTQLSGEATLSGELLQLPAGALGVAVGVSARKDKINDTPGEITLAGNAWGASASGITAGDSVTTEAFGELNIPVFKDMTFAKELTLSAAGRLTNVKATRKSDGFSDKDSGNFTYKLGANWAVNDWLRFRASYGTSFRAPALFEQFLANETSFPSQRIDPCRNWGAGLAAGTTSQRVADNCAADGIPDNHTGAGVSATSIAQGGIGDLKAETSKAFVLGAIFTPRFDFLPDTRFSLAVDFYDIKVKGEITQLGAANILFGCYNSEAFSTEPLCDMFTRGQAANPYNINTVTDPFINIASQNNRGIDVAMSLRHDLGSAGSLSFLADMTWQLKDDTRLLPTSPLVSDNGESGSPSWVGDFKLSWTSANKSWNVFYGLNVIGKTSDQGDFLRANGDDPCIDSFRADYPPGTFPLYGRYCPKLKAPMVFYHNASVTKELGDGKFALTLGMSNIFDKRPPRVSVLNGGTIGMLGPVVAASQYGFIGRRMFMNVSRKF